MASTEYLDKGARIWPDGERARVVFYESGIISGTCDLDRLAAEFAKVRAETVAEIARRLRDTALNTYSQQCASVIYEIARDIEREFAARRARL